ncbi:hypothetical protein B0H67DRAFT_658681, partial [Lasiosphaeris hirsuta]
KTTCPASTDYPRPRPRLQRQRTIPGQGQDFNVTVTMPVNLQCTGGVYPLLPPPPPPFQEVANPSAVSTGNICTVRCRNNAVAGPFGRCFAVQQTDTKAKVNTPENIATADPIDAVLAQVAQNKVDLSKVLAANRNAGDSQAAQNADAGASILGQNAGTIRAFSTLTPVAASATAVANVSTTAAAATATAATGNKGGNGNGNRRSGRNRGNNKRRFVVADEDESS